MFGEEDSFEERDGLHKLWFRTTGPAVNLQYFTFKNQHDLQLQPLTHELLFSIFKVWNKRKFITFSANSK